MKILLIVVAFCFATNARSQIQMDKVSHFAVGGVIGGLGYSVAHKVSDKKWLPFTTGIALGFTTGIAKEVYDRRKYNPPLKESLKDIGWTTLGSGIACLTLRICF